MNACEASLHDYMKFISKEVAWCISCRVRLFIRWCISLFSDM